MTTYQIKFKFVANPVIIDSEHYQNHLCKGLHYNWFREFLGLMQEIDWVLKLC